MVHTSGHNNQIFALLESSIVGGLERFDCLVSGIIGWLCACFRQHAGQVNVIALQYTDFASVAIIFECKLVDSIHYFCDVESISLRLVVVG
jgi:hypothetical protein